jgi:hypothetical protein
MAWTIFFKPVKDKVIYTDSYDDGKGDKGQAADIPSTAPDTGLVD